MSDDIDDDKDDDNVDVGGTWSRLKQDSPLNNLFTSKVIEHFKESAESAVTEAFENPSMKVTFEETDMSPGIRECMDTWLSMLGPQAHPVITPVHITLDKDMHTRIQAACNEVNDLMRDIENPGEAEINAFFVKKLHEHTGFCWCVNVSADGHHDLSVIVHYGDEFTMTSPMMH